MSPKLAAWNSLPDEEAASILLAFCGSRKWARCLVRARPLEGRGAVLRAVENCWTALAEADWLEAIAAHPAIGAPDLVGLAAREQSSVRSASLDTLASLADANRDYRDRFGWIFLICARGKTAEEMLSLCRERLHNEPRTELGVAAEEQKKITRLRLEDWLA
ncbi:MAG TPA: 2-oxo-4-hydroxy-4-carboxy-5-ureidoimidazoline decarboxylase, partial [Thermoanaerobaculia bacterium]